jgi:RNA-directed DNA polymerase
MGFQYEQDARAMREALGERLGRFGLELHPEKTRVLQFGRHARERREREGLGKPETFDFLGFTHIVGVTRRGKYQLHRRTSRNKRRAKLARLKEECQRRRHSPVEEQYRWLSLVLNGHYRYYAVPTNYHALASFRWAVLEIWYRSLQRRSQRSRWTVEQRRAFERRFPLPMPRILHEWPERRFSHR